MKNKAYTTLDLGPAGQHEAVISLWRDNQIIRVDVKFGPQVVNVLQLMPPDELAMLQEQVDAGYLDVIRDDGKGNIRLSELKDQYQEAA